MTLWRKVVSALLALGGALIGLLLAGRRGAGDLAASQRESEQAAADQQRIDKLDASVAATQQAVVAEEQKQRELAQQAGGIDAALAQVDARVEGLTHDNLDAELHSALGAPGAGAAPTVVKPGGVIKPAS